MFLNTLKILKMFLLFFILFKKQEKIGYCLCFRPNLFFFIAGFRLHRFFHSSVQTDVLLWCGATVIHWSLHELFPFFFCILLSLLSKHLFYFSFYGYETRKIIPVRIRENTTTPHHFFFHTTNNRNFKILPPSIFSTTKQGHT